MSRTTGKTGFDSVYSADDFVAHLRAGGWVPGTVPESVIFTYAAFDLLLGAQPDAYTMNPMLGPGPGRFFLANSTDGRVGICCMGISTAVVAESRHAVGFILKRDAFQMPCLDGVRAAAPSRVLQRRR